MADIITKEVSTNISQLKDTASNTLNSAKNQATGAVDAAKAGEFVAVPDV